MLEELSMPQYERDVLKVLADSYQALIEILTGIASSEKKEWALSIG